MGQCANAAEQTFNRVPIVSNYKAQHEVKALKDLLKAFGEVQTFERQAADELNELKKQHQEKVLKMEEEHRQEVSKLLDRLNRISHAARRERDLTRQKQADEVREMHDRCSQEMRALRDKNEQLHKDEVEYCMELTRLRTEYKAQINIQKNKPTPTVAGAVAQACPPVLAAFGAACCADTQMSAEKERMHQTDELEEKLVHGLSRNLEFKAKQQGRFGTDLVDWPPAQAQASLEPATSPDSRHPLSG